jgi:membrane protein implicated in regulation of membrane protease activity
MTRRDRNALIAAGVILAIFCLAAFLMPAIMLAIGGYSPAAAGVVAALFVAAFFLVFWFRSRNQRDGEG